MTKFANISSVIIGFLSAIILCSNVYAGSDTCMFEVSADDMPPNVVFLLDNGAEMKYAIRHPLFDRSVDFTPAVGVQIDIVSDNVNGNGFFNEYGYGIFQTAGSNYLVPVKSDLQLDTTIRLEETGAKGSGQWTLNGRTITLPVKASTTKDSNGIIDNAGFFRYSQNYLNWLFYYETAADLNGDGTVEPIYDGSALESRSRLYYAKRALLTVGKLTSNKAKFAIQSFTSNSEGSTNVQPLGEVVDTLGTVAADNILDPNYINNINNLGTVIYSPLAEGLAAIGGYIDSNSFGSIDSTNFCKKTFVIVVSTGISSADINDSNQAIPKILDDYDGDGKDGVGNNGPGQGSLVVDGTNYAIKTNYNGSTYLDDIAHYFYTHDMRVSNDTVGGYQNVSVFTAGVMTTPESRVFLINTSNNGNGNPNLSDSSNPEYGKYHFEAETPDGITQAILDAVDTILSKPHTFVAPVVPVTRTTSGDKIYMAFFVPSEENFWEGYVVKFGLDSQNNIVDVNGNPATYPNGAIREEAVPYWSTKDWSDTAKIEGIDNSSRNIYTYLGSNKNLATTPNEFSTSNAALTDAVFGYPTTPVAQLIEYVRGADVFDANSNGNTTENREYIVGDIQHSEPLVITYRFDDNSAKTMVYFGANDGMLHAVLDQIDPDVTAVDDESHEGSEAWAFIPPDQLHRLKDMVEGYGHQYFIDASPKAYFHDVHEDGVVDAADGDKMVLICGERKGGTSYFALDVTEPLAPQFLWLIGKGQTGIIELDPTPADSIIINNGGLFSQGDPLRIWDGYNAAWGPQIAARVSGEMLNYRLHYDSGTIPFSVGQFVGNLTTAVWQEWVNSNTDLDKMFSPTPFIWGKIAAVTTLINPDVIIPELGESWSEPQFGLVKTSDIDNTGTAVFFIGGGYSSDSTSGKAVIAVDVFTGSVVRKFTLVSADTLDVTQTADTSMQYSIPAAVKLIDENDNGFVDKIYVGDLGGQIWRIGQVTADKDGNALSFPDCDENINNWTGHVLFSAPTYVLDAVTYSRKFFSPPSVTFEHGYDLVFIGSGDLESACSTTTAADRIYCIKDTHGTASLTETNLVDVSDPAAPKPELIYTSRDVDSNGELDQGWYIRLVNQVGVAVGEKVLTKSTVFYKTLYIPTFTPNDNPCLPGGLGRLYALNYLTGSAVLFVGGDLDGDGKPDLTRSMVVGGGIPSKPVMVLTKSSQKLLISVGSTNPEVNSRSLDAGVVTIDPLTLTRNFYYIYWRQLFN